MKIIYVHTEPWVSQSPAVTFVTYNAIGVANNGIETHLVVPNHSSGETAAELRAAFAVEAPASLRIHRLPHRRHWRFYREAIALIERLRDDETVVVTRALSFLPHLLELRSRQRLKVMFETHDYHWSPTLRRDVPFTRMWRKSLYERLCFPQLDGMICLMETQRTLYRRHLPRLPIEVLRTGLYDVIPPRSGKDEVFAYVGSLDAYKGVGQVLAAARFFGPDSRVVIIGGKNEGEKAALLDQANKLGLSGRVRITGWINKAELARELDDVKWGLVPLDGSFFNAHLTSPLKLFDFYARGIPVLASDLPTLRELVHDGETGFLLPEWDGADAQNALVTGRRNYARLVTGVLKKAEELRWSRRGAQLGRFCATLLGRGRIRR